MSICGIPTSCVDRFESTVDAAASKSPLDVSPGSCANLTLIAPGTVATSFLTINEICVSAVFNLVNAGKNSSKPEPETETVSYTH